MRRVYWTVGLALVLALAFSGIAWAQTDSESGTSASGTDSNQIILLLTPLVAAATAVERIIEMLFGWYESTILNTNDLLKVGQGYLGWAQEQVQKWKTAVQWERLSGDALRQAEDALEDAQERLASYLKSPEYMARKRVLSAVLGILFGLLIGFLTQLQMFALLDIEIPWPWIDTFMTGLIIGTGSAPVHSLIGLLQKTKNAIEDARSLWSGQAYNQALDAELKRAGLQSDLQTLRELKQQMQDMLAAIEEREKGEPGVMATTRGIEGEPKPAPEAAEPPRRARPMGNAELDRRVQRILR